MQNRDFAKVKTSLPPPYISRVNPHRSASTCPVWLSVHHPTPVVRIDKTARTSTGDIRTAFPHLQTWTRVVVWLQWWPRKYCFWELLRKWFLHVLGAIICKPRGRTVWGCTWWWQRAAAAAARSTRIFRRCGAATEREAHRTNSHGRHELLCLAVCL